MLLGRFEFAQEASIILREETQVADTILQVGDALYTHTEGITGIDIAVDAASLEVVRVYHTATQNLYPSCMLAEVTSLAAADVA